MDDTYINIYAIPNGNEIMSIIDFAKYEITEQEKNRVVSKIALTLYPYIGKLVEKDNNIERHNKDWAHERIFTEMFKIIESRDNEMIVKLLDMYISDIDYVRERIKRGKINESK